MFAGRPGYFHSLLLGACLAVCLAPDSGLFAQQRNQRDPHIGYIYPAGGKKGSTVEVTIGGQFLDGVSGVRLTGDGVQATVEKHTKPLSAKEFNELRDKLMEARMKMAMQPDMMKMDLFAKRDLLLEIAKEINLSDDKINALMDYRKKITNPKRQQNAQLAESVILKVAIPEDAPMGPRELRLITPLGLSNPLKFYVGAVPEFIKPESEDPIKNAMPLSTMPVTINGQLLPGHVDRYSFTGKKGMRFVAKASVRALIPYLADAVPGWFQAALTLYDEKGRELASAQNFRYDPDPVLFYEIPSNGTYTLEVKDALYRGREDFIYRVTIGELPVITSIFPMGEQSGERINVRATGWNIPAGGFVVEKVDMPDGVQPFWIVQGDNVSNEVPFEVDKFPECTEKEPNNQIQTAQKIFLPCIINGKIDQTGDWDVYSFEGRDGDQLIAEVRARRLNSPLDSILVLMNASGKKIAINDDFVDKSEGLSTQHADSKLIFTLPENGTYFLKIGNVENKGGTDYVYRLRISKPQPDFTVQIMPSSINANSVIVPLDVCIQRRDGFNEEVSLSLKRGPTGATLNGGRIPAGQDQIRMTMTIPSACSAGTYPLEVEASATANYQEIIRTAIPADDMMQAFIYRHNVTSKEQLVTVPEKRKFYPPVRLAQSLPIELKKGESNRIRFTSTTGPQAIESLKLELSNAPDGITVENLIKKQSDIILVLKVDPEKIKGELKSNLLIETIIEKDIPPSLNKPAGKQRSIMGLLPAIPFDVSK